MDDLTPKCRTCGNPMVALFLSCVCDYCERKPNYGSFYRGWVVWREPESALPHYVFANRFYAERYKRGQNSYEDGEVRMVFSKEPFHWRTSMRVNLRNYEFADQLFQIYPDHRFRWISGRAFLAPLEVQRVYELY